jgi:hypothetical protein
MLVWQMQWHIYACIHMSVSKKYVLKRSIKMERSMDVQTFYVESFSVKFIVIVAMFKCNFNALFEQQVALGGYVGFLLHYSVHLCDLYHA